MDWSERKAEAIAAGRAWALEQIAQYPAPTSGPQTSQERMESLDDMAGRMADAYACLRAGRLFTLAPVSPDVAGAMRVDVDGFFKGARHVLCRHGLPAFYLQA